MYVKNWQARCEQYDRLNFFTAHLWLHGYVVPPQLKNARLDWPKLIKFCPRADGKLLRKVKIQPGLSVPCEQSDHIKRFHVNEVSYQIIQLIENSSGAAVW